MKKKGLNRRLSILLIMALVRRSLLMEGFEFLQNLSERSFLWAASPQGRGKRMF